MLTTAATVFLVLALTFADPPERGISRQQLENWASRFGGPLFEFGQSVTKYKEVLWRFQNSRDSRVEQIKLEHLLPHLTKDIEDNLEERVDAIQKLVSAAENRALEWITSSAEKRRGETAAQKDSYFNAKKVQPNEMSSLTFDPVFGRNVNPGASSVHVPTSIYESDDDLLQGLAWSSVLDETFSSNRHGHPSLHWQYFGSALGFMRQFPGAPWPNSSADVPDLYDCRFRPWYVGAANKPKNMVILLDVSGSMTGQRREIARHVVYTILDTLTENDYVAVYNFSSDLKAVLPCFNSSLVQANLEYIREIKEGLDQEKTSGVANFPLALNYAFDMLEQGVRETESGGGCNNAIMLVTDGAPYNYEEVFASRQSALNPVRVFTYLTGKEVTDFREVRWMACHNQGYFVHISTLSEVQEQVLKYLPVMSRPLVMLGRHDTHWTPIYADMVKVEESDWAWERILAVDQRRDSLHYRCQFRGEPDCDAEEHHVPHHRINTRAAPNFVVSASIPVFDQRNSTRSDMDRPSSTNDSAPTQPTTQERIAKFLGVVGTDVPLKELKRLLKPFKLGVNGYGFIVNNNGHIVVHPDWRPMYKDILKPNYNTVDMAEMELMDSKHTGRNNDSEFLQMRGEIVRGEKNYRRFPVRIHQDNFRRVGVRNHRYEYKEIRGTPYTLVLVAPEGMNRFHGEIEVFLARRTEGVNVSSFFDQPNEEGRRWTVNPGWHYCQYIHTTKERKFDSDEDLILHFLDRAQFGDKHASAWKWRNTGVGLKKQKRDGSSRDIYDCDKELVQALVFDANVTEVLTSSRLWKFNKNESQIIGIYGALLAFIATRSGFTRWIEFGNTHSQMGSPNATDELWYQRAVDRYAVDPNSFVFSVPIHEGDKSREGLEVTATRAMYVRKNGWEAPVAVVGIQFNHTKWAERFFEITGNCIDGRANCKTCKSDEFDCFVLDDNGFILVTENKADVGKFFGEVNGMVMEMLVNSDVYKRVRVVDYQAVCLRPVTRTSLASILSTPLSHLLSVSSWVVGQLVSMALQIGLDTLLHPSWGEAMSQFVDGDEDGDMVGQSTEYSPPAINKTKLRPCDVEYDLYTYGPSYNTYNFSYHGLLTKCGHNCDGYFNVHYIHHTNLILVVTDGKCPCGHNFTSLEGREAEYSGSESESTNGDHPPIQTCTRPKLQLTRKRPSSCIPINPEEKVIQDDYCGGGSGLESTTWSLLLGVVGLWMT